MVKVEDPASGTTGEVDPSTIPGYYGEFKAQSSSGASENTALFLDVGDDFSFGFDTNDDILEATQVEDNTDRTQVIQKLFSAFSFGADPWSQRNNPSRNSGRRRLQEANAAGGKKLFNPVLCITEGDAVFFNVNSDEGQYPAYEKDSILNTNPDFDFAPFEVLADMINRQNITVTTYSHVFKDQGIFVFENSKSGSLSIISVVASGQTCSNAVNGVGASMVTKEALDEIGVKSYEK